jgi:hypothetical protein
MTMTLVETITVGSGGAASIEFTGIPQDGKDLLVKFSFRRSASGDYSQMNLTLNNTGGTSYNAKIVYGNNFGVTSSSDMSSSSAGLFWANAASSTASTFASGELYLANYAGSSAKSFSIDAATENNSTAALRVISARSFNNTAPISSVKFAVNSGTLVEFSLASLYSIS